MKIRSGVLVLWLMLFIEAGIRMAFVTANASENFILDEGEELPRSSYSKQVHEEIETVLSSDDFARKETVRKWRRKNMEDPKVREEEFPEWLIEVLEVLESTEDFFSALAKVLEILLWALVIGIIVFLIIKFRDPLVGFISNMGTTEKAPELPTTMFGLDVQKTSLPKDVVGTARQSWNAGNQRQAVAVLLRASLISLLHDHGCRFFDSDTEAECCERIEEQASSQLSDYMWQLVRVWQQLAYAHRAPKEEQFDALCVQWQAVF